MSSASQTLPAFGGDFLEEAFARVTDPETSHEAARKVENITEQKRIILEFLSTPMTDHVLVARYIARAELGFAPMVSESSIRSRRAALRDAGKVRFTGEYQQTPAGNRARVWEATGE